MLHRLLILVQVFMLVVQPRICTCAAAVGCEVCQCVCESDCDCCCDHEECVADQDQQIAAPSHDHKPHTQNCLAIAPRLELKQSDSGVTVNLADDVVAEICPFDLVTTSNCGPVLVEESPPRPAIPLFLSLCTILV